MATMQPQMIPDEAQGQPEEQQQFEVCISQRPDGSYEVTKEVKEEPQEPPDAMTGPEEGGEQIAKTIDEALSMARQLLQDNGQGMTPEQAFSDGFNQ